MYKIKPITIQDVKLKHLTWVSGESVDFPTIMRELYSYTGKGVMRVYKFKKIFPEAYKLGLHIANLDPTTIDPPKNSIIQYPPSIDYIPFIARMELEAAMSDITKKDIGEDIAHTIAIVCYNWNTKNDFDSSSRGFNIFFKKVLNHPILDMLGYFNKVLKDSKESASNWDSRFKEVDNTDPDYIMAGGMVLDRFNVINTIKKVCNDFNVSYKDAWQLPYITVQTNSLSCATSAMVQEKMSKIKENKMRAASRNK